MPTVVAADMVPPLTLHWTPVNVAAKVPPRR